MLRVLAAVVLLAGGLPAGAGGCPDAPPTRRAAPERTVTIGAGPMRIAGTLAGPAGAPAAAAVLMLHGYTGTRDELPTAAGEGLFARAARAFAERGIASLRIDFRGSGSSAGRWADTTLAGQAADARAAFAQLAAAGPPPAVLGFSQGGLVALLAFGGDADVPLALWNPVLDPAEAYGAILGPGAWRAALDAAATGQGGRIMPGGLRAAFFAAAAAADPLAAARAHPAPLMLVAGRHDRLAPGAEGRAAALARDRAAPTVTVAVEAGHDLGAAADLALADAAIACTAAFLLRPR